MVYGGLELLVPQQEASKMRGNAVTFSACCKSIQEGSAGPNQTYLGRQVATSKQAKPYPSMIGKSRR